MIPRHRPEFTLRDLTAAHLKGPQWSQHFDRPDRTAFWVPSGRSGLAGALRLLNARQAIVPAFNCWAVMEALQYENVRPIFVDVDADLNMDYHKTAAAIDRAPPGTVLVITHQFGVPVAKTRELVQTAAERGLKVLEDGAAAYGAVTNHGAVGTVGDASVVSFQYTKTAFAGDGGLLYVGSELAEAATDLTARYRTKRSMASASMWMRLAALSILTEPRLYGHTLYRAVGTGTDNQADAVIVESLFEELPTAWMRRLAATTGDRVPGTLEARRRISRLFIDALSSTDAIVVPATANEAAAPIRFPVLVEDRDVVVERASALGLDLGRSFAYTCGPRDLYPNARRVADSIVNLPLSGRLERYVPGIIQRFVESMTP